MINELYPQGRALNAYNTPYENSSDYLSLSLNGNESYVQPAAVAVPTRRLQ